MLNFNVWKDQKNSNNIFKDGLQSKWYSKTDLAL